MTSASPPSSSTSRAAASSPARPRARSATLQTRLANSRAVARPIPADAPVITATSPVRGSRMTASGIADSPHRIADVVGENQRAGAIDRHPNRPAPRLPFIVEEAGHEIDRRADRPAAGEADEHHAIAVELVAVPAAVLADEGTAVEHRREAVAGVEGEPERRDVRAEAVIRLDRARDQFGMLRPHPRIDVLSPIAVRPAVEAAVAHG